jgi:hypothetical protein
MTTLDEQFEALYGPIPAYSDYKRGETITYRVGTETHTGKIVWVVAAGQVVVQGRKPLPTRYIVERDGAGNSFPDDVWQSDIVVDPGQ